MRNDRRSKPAFVRRLVLPAVLAAGFGFVSLLDRAVFTHLDWPRAEREDWHKMLRSVGTIPFWIIAGILVARLSGRTARTERPLPPLALGIYVMGAAGAAGLVAELAKIVFRRLRPSADVEGYQFRPFSVDTFSSSGLGLPSSHTQIAFAGAVALCVVAPRGGLVWIGLALGCAFTRLVDRAHWLSDAYAGAVLGALVAWLIARLIGFGPRRRSGGLFA